MYHRTLHTLLLLSLGIMLGALVFFGLGVAGILFNPELVPSRTLSGALNTRVLERLMVLFAASGVLALGAYLPLYFSRPKQSNLAVGVLLVGLLALVLYLSLVLFPEADALRTEIGSFDPVLPSKADVHARFEVAHERFSMLTKISSGLAFLAFVAHLVWPGRFRKRVDGVAEETPSDKVEMGSATTETQESADLESRSEAA